MGNDYSLVFNKLAHDELYVSLRKLHDMAEKKIVNTLALNMMCNLYNQRIVKPLLNEKSWNRKQRKEYLDALWEYRDNLYHKTTVLELVGVVNNGN